ncbi:unnamed protein product [Cunninghamella echinulata]
MGSETTKETMIQHLKHAVEAGTRATQLGGQPFGAILVSEDGRVLAEQGNINILNHAEDVLCRHAFVNYPTEFLKKCTMYASFEPCSMCSSAIYWSGIGKLVYGIDQKRFFEATGLNENNFPTLKIPCRDVFNAGNNKVEVVGPFPEIEKDILKDHLEYWKK